MRSDPTCATCASVTKTARYCAPARCYCGHAECPAVASYIDMATVPLADVAGPRSRTSWKDREGSTWLDKL